MDFRGKKVFDYVAVEKYMKECLRKNEIIQTQWLHRFEWMLDDYKSMQEELLSLREEKQTSGLDVVSVKKDKRSIRPIPVTTSGEYGWLASKPEFRLENPHDYIVKFPNPMDEIKLLKVDIPKIAPGKGFL